MTETVKNMLDTFANLSLAEQREVAVEIIRRTTHFELPPITDDELIACAEELFLTLEREEAANGHSRAW